MSGIQRYEPWPQEWPMEDANGDLVTYEDHVKVVEELVDALSLILAWHDKDKYASGKMTFERSGAFAKARAALAKIKEQQA